MENTQTRHNPSLNEILEKSVRNNWDRLALTDLGGINYRYRDLAECVEKLHLMFDAAGVKKGDKIAICGKNSANWAAIFISCLSAGVVAVPILHEFKPDTIHHLVNHSDAKLLFVDKTIWENLDEKLLPHLVGALFISELGMPLSRSEKLTETRDNINELFGRKYPREFTKKDVNWFHDNPEDLALINYTSGSTGMSKGVMLPYRSIWSNIRYCIDNLDFLKPGDGIVNMLPLAHLYGMVIEMLHPLAKGCHCNFVTRIPSPRIILGAFEEVHPKLIITVPLILEKIIKNNVFPVINKPVMRFALKVPYLKDYLLGKIRTKLIMTMGGELREVIIGGAALNAEVGAFLDKIKFPYTVGYGMTECGPLISYCDPEHQKPGSVGKVVDRMQVRVDSHDPENVAGNLWVKGDNVMKGYYKNPEATAEVMGKDGWMNTGDLCRIDKDGYIFVSGRSKNMILGPSGQNIYPEEIEQKLNNLPYVNESLVIDDGGHLVALIHPDYDKLNDTPSEEVEKIMDRNIKDLNEDLPSYSRISRFKIMPEEFEKTPKRSIKRFLYQP